MKTPAPCSWRIPNTKVKMRVRIIVLLLDSRWMSEILVGLEAKRLNDFKVFVSYHKVQWSRTLPSSQMSVCGCLFLFPTIELAANKACRHVSKSEFGTIGNELRSLLRHGGKVL
jgi:hypothetical protein